jgi:hypothetical protein
MRPEHAPANESRPRAPLRKAVSLKEQRFEPRTSAEPISQIRQQAAPWSSGRVERKLTAPFLERRTRRGQPCQKTHLSESFWRERGVWSGASRFFTAAPRCASTMRSWLSTSVASRSKMASINPMTPAAARASLFARLTLLLPVIPVWRPLMPCAGPMSSSKTPWWRSTETMARLTTRVKPLLSRLRRARRPFGCLARQGLRRENDTA